LGIAHRHPDDAQTNAEPRSHEHAVALDGLVHATTDSPAANEAQIHSLHIKSG
jgi:hypothetical protein